MRRIALINMPFANLALPSIALTQLKAIAEEQLPGEVSVEILYLNHDFGRYAGRTFYDYLADSMEAHTSGLGDWIFRQAVSPTLADNTEAYLGRYFPRTDAEHMRLRESIARFRAGLDGFMDELIEKYRLAQYDIVGFTSMFMQNAANLSMSRKLKERNPGITILMGGANCEFPMGAVLAEKFENIDFVFSGPALKSFPEFLRYWIAGNIDCCRSIRGILSRTKARSERGSETVGEDLAIDVPIKLDFEPYLKQYEEYFPEASIKPSLPFETSRGCWWGERSHCTFCGLNGVSMAYRAMKPDSAIALFNSLFRYEGRIASLSAVDNILPKSYLRDVLPFLKTPEGLTIFYEVKADLSEEDIATLKRARVDQIQPGIEALATSTLKLMKKGTTAFQNIQLLKLCCQYGITPHWNLLVGFPGEGPESYMQYLDVLPRILHLPPPSGPFPVRFDRFSPYFYKADSYNLELKPLDFYSFVYPLEEEDMRDLAYYFYDNNFAADYFLVMAEWIERVNAEITKWRQRWSTASADTTPQLYFKDERTIIDSRSGIAIERSVSETGKAILDLLSRPVRIEGIVEKFGPAAMREIEALDKLQLIFRENDRLLSLMIGPRMNESFHPCAEARPDVVEEGTLVHK